MKLIVGLGNPGPEYELTPHNLGFLAVDLIAEQARVEIKNRRCRALTAKAVIAGEEVLLAKPETFMNLSGASVRELVSQFDATFDVRKDLIVIYDELAFPLGTLRIRERGSSGGHNGLESIIGALGTEEFVRIRLGVGPDHPVSDGARYLLSAMKKKDLAVVGEVLDRAAEAVKVICEKGVSAAMNQFNRKAEEAAE